MFAFGPVIRQPALGRHTGSVILLHGLGDTGEGKAACMAQAAGLPEELSALNVGQFRPCRLSPGWVPVARRMC